ncbi:hypothetical protein HG536_0G00960 [Torulaspora globosa]|uniref:Eisosome protein 1 n=1 Tax=Torulaspora globosa TaxID=48254 RepID=A0A7G3ZL53_9SACH|nr:uncharacterized protein HG536_0G00960 [Torulaspora globosa]QLL34239.1 hypothetical protein HG536_0G00960 [Torulaspora globosa]
MSLVSAVKERDRYGDLQDDHEVRRETKMSSSVYQTSGEPLSKEALYRAKLKYGVYQSPATNISLGVAQPKEASGRAANVANENKITINAYKRLFVDPGAAHAATKVGLKGVEPAPVVEVKKSHAGSQSAATRAYSIASSTASTKKVTKSAHAGSSSAAGRDRLHSVSSATHALGASATFNEQKVNPAPKPLNMSKVLSGAERQAERRIHDRTSPERKNFSYGLRTGGAGKAAGNSFELSKDTLEKISAKIDSAAIEREADPQNYAEWAAYAVRDVDPSSLMDAEFQDREKRRQQYLSQLTSQQVLAKARENADRELKAIDALDTHRQLFGNEAYNKAAVETAREMARKNAQKMAPYQNKINMGGGLWLSPDEVNDIAENLINPVLGEVTQRAEDQRATDLDIKERTEAHKAEYAAWLEMQHTKIRNNATIVVNTNIRHEREKEENKEKATKDYNELVAMKDKQIADKEEKLARTKQAKTEFETEMEGKLKSEDERVALVLANFGETNKKDLEDARKEQEELLRPYHDALDAAEKEHARLLEEKSGIQKEIEKLRTSIDAHGVLLLKYERGIKANDEKQAVELKNLQNLDSEKQKLRSDIDENVINLANRAKEQAAISSEQARLRQLEVDALVNERKSRLNETEIELQREKLNMLDAMREAAEARGDTAIDEDRVKELLGMSSEDYVAQQKNAVSKTETRPVGADLDEEDEADEDNLSEGVKPARHLDLGAFEGPAPSASVRSIADVSARIPESLSEHPAKGDKSSDVSWSEKFFLGAARARKRRESQQKSEKPEISKPAETAKTAEPSGTAANAGHELQPTFSGFSQDGIAAQQDAGKKKGKSTESPTVDDSEDEDEEDVPDLSGTDRNDDLSGANKRSSYFQEVFE